MWREKYGPRNSQLNEDYINMWPKSTSDRDNGMTTTLDSPFCEERIEMVTQKHSKFFCDENLHRTFNLI